MATPSQLGARIRSIREAADIGASQLSEAIGASRSLVWHIENGLIQDPSFSTVERIAQALGTTGRHIAYGEGRAPSVRRTRAAFDRLTSLDATGSD